MKIMILPKRKSWIPPTGRVQDIVAQVSPSTHHTPILSCRPSREDSTLDWRHKRCTTSRPLLDVQPSWKLGTDAACEFTTGHYSG